MQNTNSTFFFSFKIYIAFPISVSPMRKKKKTKTKENYMKFSFFLVSTGVWHISRYFENLKFYNNFRIIFYKIHSDYILKHNKNYSPQNPSLSLCPT